MSTQTAPSTPTPFGQPIDENTTVFSSQEEVVDFIGNLGGVAAEWAEEQRAEASGVTTS